MDFNYYSRCYYDYIRNGRTLKYTDKVDSITVIGVVDKSNNDLIEVIAITNNEVEHIPLNQLEEFTMHIAKTRVGKMWVF